MNARELANVAYSAARGGMAKSFAFLFVVSARAADQRMGRFSPQELANTAWAFATAAQ